jgi:hypothetical protein
LPMTKSQLPAIRSISLLALSLPRDDDDVAVTPALEC